MQAADCQDAICAVVYRATVAGRREGVIRLRTSADAATLADAWTRLSARYGRVDPASIEIEIREIAGDAR